MTYDELRSILQNRTTTSFGVSIGTGLLLESMFDPIVERYDPDRPIPARVEMKKYPYWLINVYTLIRNILHCLNERIDESNIDKNTFANAVMKTLKEEIMIIRGLVSSVDLHPDWLQLWVPKYETLIKKFNVGKDITDLKYVTKNIEAFKLYGPLVKEIDYITKVEPSGDYKFSSVFKEALITTSFPLDLLQSNYLTLLESHTGILKDNHLWYTKYHPMGKADLSRLPMSDIVLYLMGDGYLVKSSSITVRRELLSIAESKNWSYRTTKDKIIANFKESPILTEAIQEFKSY
jgi:PHIKZ066|nr:MAG TPA: hypothetical protein [Caudoviricetes sp.]